MTQQSRVRSCLPAVLLLALAAAGCDPARGTVSGRVTYQGRPLPTGTVQFFCGDGQILSGLIREDGTYSVADVPAGPVRVTVVSHPPVPTGFQLPQHLPPSNGAPAFSTNGPTTAKAPANRAVAIPERYGAPEHSGLSLEVTRGDQVYDIPLSR